MSYSGISEQPILAGDKQSNSATPNRRTYFTVFSVTSLSSGDDKPIFQGFVARLSYF